MRHTYILLCSDNTLYTGITTDLERRVSEHNHSPLGATYTKSRRPLTLVRSTDFSSRSQASKEEYRIKQMTKAQKTQLIEKNDIDFSLHNI